MGSLLLGPDGEVLQLSLYENHTERLQLAHLDEVTEEEKGTVSCGINNNGYFYLSIIFYCLSLSVYIYLSLSF